MSSTSTLPSWFVPNSAASPPVGFEASFTKAAELEDRGRGKGTGKRGKAVQKYRNPEDPAETWSGRGRPPKWVQAALAGGRTMAGLQIEAV